MSEENKPQPVRRVSRKIYKGGGGRRDDVCDFSDHTPQVVARNRDTKSTIDITERRDKLNTEGFSRGEKKEKNELRRLKVTKRKEVSSLKEDYYEPCVSPRKETNHVTDIVNAIPKEKFKSKISKSKSNKSETTGDNSKLLGQIEGGFKLKSTKHLMVDKSGPIITGVSSSGSEQSQRKPPQNSAKHVENKLKLKINIPNGSNSISSKVGKKPRAFSVFSLEDELKQKLRILEEKSQTKQKETSRPPLPPKPKYSPSVEMDAAFKNSPRFRSLRNLRKKSNFENNERIKQINDNACNKSDDEGSVNEDDTDNTIPKHSKQLSNSSEYQKERIASSETNLYAKNRSEMGFSKKVASPSDHFLENRKKLGNLFGNVSEQNLNDVSKNRDRVSANNLISSSSKSVNTVGKDLPNKPNTRKPSVNTASSNSSSYNIDSDDNEISYESDDLSSNGTKHNTINTGKSNTHKINNIHQSSKGMGNMRSSHMNMRKVLQRLPSITSIKDSSDESELSEYDLDVNYGINNNMNENKVGIHSQGDNNYDSNVKSKDQSGVDQNMYASKYKNNSSFYSTRENENKMSSQYDKIKITDNAKKETNTKSAHSNNGDIKGPVRNEGLVRAPLKRPTCPPPLPPLLQKPQKPQKPLSFNKDFEARFTFNDICKLPPPFPYKTSRFPTSTPSIATNQVLRFLQKPNVNLASKKSLPHDPYETTV